MKSRGLGDVYKRQNYDLTEGVNVTDKPSGEKAMKIVGGIDYPDIYEIKGEKNNCFEINFKGKTAYTEKAWYHILDDIKAINDGKIYEKADEKSKEISNFKKDEKVVLVNFDSNKDFLKVKKGDKTGSVSYTHLTLPTTF